MAASNHYRWNRYEALARASALGLAAGLLTGCAMDLAILRQDGEPEALGAGDAARAPEWAAEPAATEAQAAAREAEAERRFEERLRLERLRLERLSRQGEVTTGMGAPDVAAALGEPLDVEYAGPAQAGNMRWIYREGVSRALASERVIYFEEGKVAGWETVRKP